MNLSFSVFASLQLKFEMLTARKKVDLLSLISLMGRLFSLVYQPSFSPSSLCSLACLSFLKSRGHLALCEIFYYGQIACKGLQLRLLLLVKSFLISIISLLFSVWGPTLLILTKGCYPEAISVFPKNRVRNGSHAHIICLPIFVHSVCLIYKRFKVKSFIEDTTCSMFARYPRYSPHHTVTVMFVEINCELGRPLNYFKDSFTS